MQGSACNRVVLVPPDVYSPGWAATGPTLPRGQYTLSGAAIPIPHGNCWALVAAPVQYHPEAQSPLQDGENIADTLP